MKIGIIAKSGLPVVSVPCSLKLQDGVVTVQVSGPQDASESMIKGSAKSPGSEIELSLFPDFKIIPKIKDKLIFLEKSFCDRFGIAYV